MRSFLFSSIKTLFAILLVIGCAPKEEKQELPKADENNAGLTLQPGFGALVTVDNVGKGRHLAVSEQGDLYVKFKIT